MKPDIAGLKWELKGHPFFGSLTEGDFDSLLSRARPAVYKARAQIFAQGAKSDSLFIILSGRIKIAAYSGSGAETVLTFMGAGDILGEMGVFSGAPRSAAAIALEETRALQLSRLDVLGFLERNPSAALHVIATLSERLRQTNQLVEEIANLPAAQRLARVLLRLAEHYGKPGDGGEIRIDMKLSQGNLGAHAGLKRENVNRQLRQWEAEGVLAQDGGYITLIQLDQLRRLIADD
ncbi:MAG: Crp/Fnr family transcriptional regulator [Parvularculaceae bacterium]